MTHYPFIPELPYIVDLVIDLGRAGHEKTNPRKDAPLKEIAAALDRVLLSPRELRTYFRALEPFLVPLHDKLGKDPESGKGTAIDDLPYLRPLEESQIASILRGPLEPRDDSELSALRIDLLALNTPALESLQEEILDAMPDSWTALYEDEQWWRRQGEVLPAFDGIAIPGDPATGRPTRELAGVGERGRSASGAPRPTGKPGLVVLSIRLDDIPTENVKHRENIAVDQATFAMEYGGLKLAVRAGGFVFVGPGCTLKLRWLKRDGKTLNGTPRGDPTDPPCAEANSDVDVPIHLQAPGGLVDGQWLEFEFTQATHRPYSLKGRVQVLLDDGRSNE